jgi:hypothetical protein
MDTVRRDEYVGLRSPDRGARHGATISPRRRMDNEAVIEKFACGRTFVIIASIFIGHIAIQQRLSNPKVLSRVRRGVSSHEVSA